MKVTELFETRRLRPRGLKGHYYQMPYSWINRDHRGFERIFNEVLPKVAEAMGVPRANVDYEGHTPESGLFTIKITSSKTEKDMVELMFPKAVKAKLEKAGFENVQVTDAVSYQSNATRTGKQFDMFNVLAKVSYPQKWIDWDKNLYR